MWADLGTVEWLVEVRIRVGIAPSVTVQVAIEGKPRIVVSVKIRLARVACGNTRGVIAHHSETFFAGKTSGARIGKRIGCLRLIRGASIRAHAQTTGTSHVYVVFVLGIVRKYASVRRKVTVSVVVTRLWVSSPSLPA